jgi:hypothetical protein
VPDPFALRQSAPSREKPHEVWLSQESNVDQSATA